MLVNETLNSWTPSMPNIRKKVQHMRTMFPMGLSEMRRD